MWLHIGLFTYLLIKSCSSLGHVAYPLDDNKEQRSIVVCVDYGSDQTEEIFFHEVMHACLHNHEHHFKTKQALDKHLSILPNETEEALVGSLSSCMVPVLGDKDANRFLGIK